MGACGRAATVSWWHEHHQHPNRRADARRHAGDRIGRDLWAAARGAELVAFSLVVVNMAIQPTISRLYAAGEMQRLQRVITTAARVTVALALPAALILSLLDGRSWGLSSATNSSGERCALPFYAVRKW